MSKNICVLVLSVGRSGSSATAGMHSCLGVDMGVKFQDSDRNNTEGTFEDLAFVNLNRAILTGQAEITEFAGMVRNKPLWGVKDPQFCLTVGHFLPYLEQAGVDVRVVVVRRDREKAIESYNRAYLSGRIAAEKWYDLTVDALEKNLAAFNGRILDLQWEEILENPANAAWKLATLVGINAQDPRVELATRHIQPRKKPEGWGSIALGVRISKFPEPDFFKSWTALLTGGVESRDKVLLPVSHQPAHTAANKLATSFLYTQCDSILFLDDDMVFDGDALNRLRYNKDNWDYDIVSGFTTTRVSPPKPIVMQLQDPQPELPESLKGDSFDLAKDFIDGEVKPVDATGLAFTLVKRHVFEAMLGEYGIDYTYFFSYGRGIESDDIPFCGNARELGFKLAVDTNAKIGHIGQIVLGWQEYHDWKNDHQFDASDLIPILEFAKQTGVNGQVGESAAKILEAING